MSQPSPFPHQPVLYHEIIHALKPHSPGKFIDATIGAGGHAWGILEHSSPDGRLLGFDQDPQALALASQRLSPFKGRFELVNTSYINLQSEMRTRGWEQVEGIVFDLGVSSMQLDMPQRGFSFQTEGPLDMRFDPNQDTSAADLVNDMPEEELAQIIWRYGEERYARRIAQGIVRARPLRTTTQLAEVIYQVLGGRKERIHPATRTFQALRIAVNDELAAIGKALPQAVTALSPGGRLAIISFHSMEDRIIKQFYRQESKDCICPPGQPVCNCGHKASLRVITRRPIQPGEAEIEKNPRARSARLRVAEKLG